MAAKENFSKDLNLIGEGTVIEGKLKSSGSVRVDGRFVGEIHAQDAVAVGHSGEVEGSVVGKNVTVGGKVRGSLTAQEKLVFESRAVVQGEIRATRLVVDEGALFDGKCSMSGGDVSRRQASDAGMPRRDAKPPVGSLEGKQ